MMIYRNTAPEGGGNGGDTGAAPANTGADDAFDAGLVVGMDARPDGLPSHLWDEGRKAVLIGAAIKRSSDLQATNQKLFDENKALKEPPSRVPEGGYALELPEQFKGLHVPDDDPFLVSAKTLAQEANLDNAGFNKLAATLLGSLSQQDAIDAANTAAFGKAAPAEIEANAKFVNGGLGKVLGDLGYKEDRVADVKNGLAALSFTPMGGVVLKAIRDMVGERKVIDTGGAQPADGVVPTKAELDSMVADPRYQKRDPAFVAKVDAAFERAYPSGQ